MGKKILVIDDSATVRQQVRAALEQVGFEVEEAVDGQDGVDKIGTGESYSAAICDVNMPRMTGLELLETIAGKGCKLPVIMLTTEGQPTLIQRAKEAGAKGWIVKPFKANLLVSAIQKLTA